MTPIQELINQLKEERHRYMMQEHHPLELYLIYSCFDSAIWKAKELLEKEKTNAIEDYRAGRTDQQSGHGTREFNRTAEQYYTENYEG